MCVILAMGLAGWVEEIAVIGPVWIVASKIISLMFTKHNEDVKRDAWLNDHPEYK